MLGVLGEIGRPADYAGKHFGDSGGGDEAVVHGGPFQWNNEILRCCERLGVESVAEKSGGAVHESFSQRHCFAPLFFGSRTKNLSSSVVSVFFALESMVLNFKSS